MSWFIRKLLVSILFLFCYGSLKPQSKPLLVQEEKYACFVRFDAVSDLKNKAINAIAQDIQGFIWVGTEDGLYRYDGYNFELFVCKTETGGNASTITSLCTDFNGNLWLGTTKGLFGINTTCGKFTPFVPGSTQEKQMLQSHIRKVIFSIDSCLLTETLDGNLCKYCPDSKTWEIVSHKPPSQPYYRYHALYSDNENNVWFGGRNLGLHILTPKRELKHFKAFGNQPGFKRDEDVADIFCSSKKTWYVVATDGIYRFFPDSARFDKILASSAFSIAEDNKGFIWFGTGSGLARYNEITNTFAMYKHQSDNQNSLIDNHINQIFFDRDQNLWIGTNEGLCLLPSKSSEIKMYYRIPGDAHSLSSNKINSITEVEENRLWVGTENAGLNLINLQNSEIKNFRYLPNEPNSLPSNFISTLYTDKNNELWIGLWAGLGFCKFNKTKQNFTRYAFEPHTRKKDWYNAFLEDSEGNFWTGIWGARGMHLFDRKSREFKADYFMLPHSPYYQSVKKIRKLNNGQIFVVTGNEIIYEYQPESRQFKAFAHPGYTQDFKVVPTSHFYFELPFPPGLIRDMATKNNTAFFLTDNGIIQYSPDEGFTIFAKPKLPFYPLGFLACDEGLYVLFHDKILLYSFAGKELKKYTLPSQIKKEVNYESLLIQNNNQLFLATKKYVIKPGGIEPYSDDDFIKMPAGVTSFTYNESSGKLWVLCHHTIYTLSFEANIKLKQVVALPDEQINVFNSILISNHQVLTVGHSNFASLDGDKISGTNKISGSQLNKLTSSLSLNDSMVLLADSSNLFQFNIKTGKNELLSKPDNYMLASHLISCLFEWNKDTIFAGTTDKGLNWLQPSTGLVLHFNSASVPGQILPDSITCLEKGADGKLWIGTTRGLFTLDLKRKKIEMPKIPADNLHVKSILKTSDTSLFVATQNQWIYCNLKSGICKFPGSASGFPQFEFSRASCLLKNGEIAYGTNLGLVVFDPGKILSQKQKNKPVHFTHFTLFDKRIKHFFRTSDTIRLNYNQNFFTIGFASLDFGTIGNQTFYYRIREIDPGWVKTNRPEATYTNLEPGRYHFEVCLPFQQKDSEASQLHVFISPPFWKTIWFISLFIALALSIASYILYLYIKKIKIKQQNTELEQKLLASQMNPHFIFNALSAIQSYMYNNQSEEAGNYLSGFSRLVRLILQNSRSRFIPLDDEIQTLKLYLKLQKLRFADKFEYEISHPEAGKLANIMVPPMMAQPFIENSIEHGILHKDGNGLISINISIREKNIGLEICDDGIGIKKARELNQNLRNHTSFATSITRERLTILEKTFKVKSEIKIIDRSTAEQTSGTRVILTIPFIYKNQIPTHP